MATEFRIWTNDKGGLGISRRSRPSAGGPWTLEYMAAYCDQRSAEQYHALAKADPGVTVIDTRAIAVAAQESR